MKLRLETFTVWLNPMDDGEPTEHTAPITHQDQLRGEQAMMAEGVNPRAALAMTNAWCWASLTRQGLYSGPWSRFREIDCAGLEPQEQPTEQDPTQAMTPAGQP